MKRDYSFALAFIAIVIVCIVLAFLYPARVHAAAPKLETARGTITILQSPEVTPEPTASPIGNEPAPVSDLTNKVLTDIEAFLGTYAGIVGLAVAFVVGLLKHVSALDNVDARLINIVVSAVFVIALLVSTNFGYGDKAKVVIDAIPQIGQIVLGLLAAFGGSTVLHEAAYAYNVPLLGTKRGTAAQAVKPSHSA